MTIHAADADVSLIDTEVFDPGHTPDVMFHVRRLVEAQRQVSITFDVDGFAYVSSPKIGDRNPAKPEPTPPMTESVRRVA